jgi:hypothetical protein
MDPELRCELYRDPDDRPPYRVRVFDRNERLVAFRRFWTRVEAEEWGQRWGKATTADLSLRA